MLPTVIAWRSVAADIDASLGRIAAEPRHAREAAAYSARIGTIKSIDQFLSDTRTFTFAMTAHGLSDMTYAKAFMRQVLEGGIDDRNSFANKLADPRYRQFAETFNFARHGETTTIFSRAIEGTVARYQRQMLEEDAGTTNEGIRLALYFQRQAPKAENTFDLLGDPALTRVVQVALGLPAATSALPVERQAELIERRLDLADLSDPAKLERFLDRFSALWDIENPQAAASDPLVSLFDPAGADPAALDSLLVLQAARGRG